MKTSLSLILIATCLIAFAPPADAQSLAGRHRLGLRLGAWNQTADVRVEAVSPTVSTSVGNNGMLGGVSYGYWLNDDLALDIDIGALTLDAETLVNTAGVSTNFAAVGEVLLGMRRYLTASAEHTTVRPYLGAGVGVFRGSQDDVVTGVSVVVSSREETAMGGRLGVGIDVFPSRRFMVGLGVGYNLMADFDEPIAGSRNYSGPVVSFDFAYLFGGGE